MDRRGYIAHVSTQLREWDTELEKLEDRARRQGEQGRAKLRRRVQQLRAKRQAVEEKLVEIRTSDKSSWRERRSGADKGIKEMKSALQAVRSTLK